jgi:KaiC/GvpD/RAD55 family RecA-like ATPase/DNA-binding NarL/FixJ family response regulator
MISSGVPTLDERLGGFAPGRVHVLSGAAGTGKTVLCLEFLAAHLDDTAPAVMITHDDPSDLLAEAQYLGIDLERPLADERLILLRYQLDFARRYGRAPSVDVVFEELARLIGPRVPGRIVVDSIAPFLEGGPASGAGVTALLQFLDSTGATSLVTFPGDISVSYDRRLESLTQRAAGIFHLTADPDRTGHLDIRKIRYQVPSTAPLHYRIEAGTGVVALSNERARRATDVADTSTRKVLVIDLSRGFPDELLQVLRSSYDVTVRTGVASSYADLVAGVGAILIEVRRDSINEVLTLIRGLRSGSNNSPIVLVTQYQMRAADRTRALRAGADDFIAAHIHPEEFLFRLENAVRRGHTSRPTSADEPLVLQPGGGGERTALTERDFRNAVDEHLHRERAPFFTVVSLRPPKGATNPVAELAMRAVRVEGGDLVGCADDRVLIFLHSARRKDVVPFIERLRNETLKSGYGELAVETAAYPADADRVQEIVHGAHLTQARDAI